MGSSQEDENRSDNTSAKNNLDVGLSKDTPQKIDSPIFPGDGAVDFPYLTDTIPSDDNFLLEDAFETQLVDLSGETQVMEVNGETQVLDDLDYLKSLPADLFDERDAEAVAGSGSEGINENDILCDTQKVSQNDPVNIDGGDSIGKGKGSISGGFTSIRTAAVRASGIAARARGTNDDSCFTRSDESSKGQRIFEQVSSSLVGDASKACLTNSGKHMQNDYNEEVEEPRNLKSCKGGTNVARKLFTEEEVAEVDQSEANMNHTDDNLRIPKFLTSENCLAGLSYANSEQPGELSQANALEVVDRFLELNAMDCDQGLDSRIHIGEKSTAVSGAKGCRDLAKSSTLQSTSELCEVYDWDDTREDEGGGDFLLKKKELFFGKGDLKLRSKGKSLYSGEKLFRKNLASDFYEQTNLASECRSPNNNMCEDIPRMENIGPDTQIAAEAMQNLCFEVNLEDDDNCINKGARDTTSKDGQCSDRATHLEQCLTNPARVVTRRAKEIKRTSVSTRNLPFPEKPGKRRRLTDPNDGISLYEKEYLSTPPSNIEEQKKGRAGIRSNIHKIDPHCRMELAGQMSKKKSCFQEQLVSSAPVAHRTRKCTELNHSKVAGENMNNIINARDCMKNRTAAKNKNAQMITIAKLSKSRSTGIKQSLASDKCDQMSAESTEINGRLEAYLKERSGTSFSTCTTPASCATPINNGSPICMGDEFHSQTCRKNFSRFSRKNEVNNLINGSQGSFIEMKESRKRRQITDIRVLFSQHLNVDVIKHQKKILVRLGAAVASSMSDATHFVADEFVRTRNMLEAIACGKPVVTHLWVESCGQASCLIDEKNYILRDLRKEKEFGFSMAASLSRACQHPLLQGQRVLVTPNTKPGKDTLTNLIKAVHGLAVERLGRSVFKDEKLPDDLLILSCEDDYDICVPFLEKGGAVYSSELLLNGIVKQKLEYERHRLFADRIKRTRSTIWMRKKDQYHPVKKCK